MKGGKTYNDRIKSSEVRLQKASIIENDKDIISLEANKTANDSEYCQITIQ